MYINVILNQLSSGSLLGPTFSFVPNVGSVDPTTGSLTELYAGLIVSASDQLTSFRVISTSSYCTNYIDLPVITNTPTPSPTPTPTPSATPVGPTSTPTPTPTSTPTITPTPTPTLVIPSASWLSFDSHVTAITTASVDNSIFVAGYFGKYGTTYVTSGSVKLNANGTLNTVFNSNSAGTGQQEGRAIAADRLGNVIFGDNSVDTVEVRKYNNTGSRIWSYNITYDASAPALMCDANNNILVGIGSTTGNNLIRLTPSGALDNTFTSYTLTGAITQGFITTVEDILIDSSNNIYIVASGSNSYGGHTSQGLWKLGPNGVIDTSFSVSNGVGRAIAFHSDGDILAFSPNVSGVNGKIRKFNPTTGVEDTTFLSNQTVLDSNVEAIRVDSTGIYVVSHASKVYKLNLNGTTNTSYTQNYNGGWDAILSDGYLWVACTDNKIRRFNSTTGAES